METLHSKMHTNQTRSLNLQTLQCMPSQKHTLFGNCQHVSGRVPAGPEPGNMNSSSIKKQCYVIVAAVRNAMAPSRKKKHYKQYTH